MVKMRTLRPRWRCHRIYNTIMQPSGHLYQSIVETGTATAVQSTTWLDQDFNMVFMGRSFMPPNHDVKKVESALVTGVENTKLQ